MTGFSVSAVPLLQRGGPCPRKEGDPAPHARSPEVAGPKEGPSAMVSLPPAPRRSPDLSGPAGRGGRAGGPPPGLTPQPGVLGWAGALERTVEPVRERWGRTARPHTTPRRRQQHCAGAGRGPVPLFFRPRPTGGSCGHFSSARSRLPLYEATGRGNQRSEKPMSEE